MFGIHISCAGNFEIPKCMRIALTHYTNSPCAAEDCLNKRTFNDICIRIKIIIIVWISGSSSPLPNTRKTKQKNTAAVAFAHANFIVPIDLFAKEVSINE